VSLTCVLVSDLTAVTALSQVMLVPETLPVYNVLMQALFYYMCVPPFLQHSDQLTPTNSKLSIL
jgi:hypothetical protein